ncbi:hypothetical protein [Micromonospora sp. WMMC273]|uniref:hypothetical protein n=1 Tax=Micromonospora sp. WMMC273 TaxID=3015157 RepID=UPI0022B6D91C|nr:hypothetical protein [Micromonospora sp. WMMC273]MCZ7478880.1 hypothetical protein [Micromonospora sp. WMMC273]
MPVEFDPAASWWIAPVEVTIGGRIYRIPALPAVDWMTALSEGTWLDIVPALLEDTGDELDDALEDGSVTHEDLITAAKDAVEVAAGVKWWTAVRLVQATAHVAGELALAGLDMTRVSLGAAVQAVYRVYTRHATEAQQRKVDSELTKLPEGMGAGAAYDEERAADAFEQMARMRGVA